mgnify:FL=1
MNCKKCGLPLDANDKFCKNCGASVEEVNAQSNQNYNNVNSMSQNNGAMFNPNQGMSYSYQSVNNTSKNNNILIILAIVLVVVIAVLAIVFVPKVLNRGNTITNNNSNTSNNGINNVSTTSKSVYKVNFANFTFKIPDNFKYELSDGAMFICDESEQEWCVILDVLDSSYEQIKNNRSSLQVSAQQNGYTAKAAEVKTLGGVEFVTIEVSIEGVNNVMAFSKLNSMYVAAIDVYTQDNTVDYDILKNVSSIISTATYNDVSNGISMPSKVDIDMKKIVEDMQ